jgi:taurine transport system permease protein
MSGPTTASGTGQIANWLSRRVSILFLLGAANLVLIFLAWYVLSESGAVPRLFLPTPGQVFARFGQVQDELALNTALTLFRVLLGFALGCGLGLAVALLSGWSRTVHRALEPVVQILKPIPPIAIAPFTLLWFGLGLSGILFLVAWGCFFVVLVDASESIRNVPKVYGWAASTLGASRLQTYLRVVLPATLPGILGGLRVAMVIAFNQALLGEFNSASGGIGEMIIRGYRFNRTDVLFLGVLITVLLAVVADILLTYSFRRAIRWAN